MLNAVFTFFARNPVAQAIAAGVAFVFAWKANNWHQRREARDRLKDQIRAEAAEQEIEKRKRIDEAENDITRDLNERSLRDVAADHPNNRRTVRQG